MKVTIKVHESHVGLVQIGQPAFVKLDSIPDQRFQGVVQKVALLPDSQARFGNPNLKVYNTEVIITDPLPGVKPGVSVQAEIIITNISNALSVPLQAVTTLKGRQVVYAEQGGKAVPTPVQVGMFNTKFIEITSGLKEGDRVLLSPPFDTQEKDLEGAVLSSDEKAKAATNAASARQASPPLKKPGGPESQSRPAGLTNPLTGPVEQPPSRELAANRRMGTARSSNPGQREPGSEEAIKPFDKDGNGELDSNEREAMRLAMSSSATSREIPPGTTAPPNGEEMMKQFDKDGDGELSATEREAMRTAMQGRSGRPGGQGGPRLSPEEMLKRFDKNGDGELDEQERSAMRESFGGGDRGSRRNRGTARPAPAEAGSSSNAPAAPPSE
jgi:Ca2+-binding EF-hand superfamily protein